MKIIERKILPYQEDNFFMPIRNKLSYAQILMHTVKSLIIDIGSEGIDCDSYFKLYVDKMRRLFVYKDEKYFSIAFPFYINTEVMDAIEITTPKGVRLDNKNTSEVLSILEDQEYVTHQTLSELFFSNDFENFEGASILEEILLSEPGYIRYDHDLEHENGNLHPLNHLDVNYSSIGTYKIGLLDKINSHYFEDFLNLNSDCLFLKP